MNAASVDIKDILLANSLGLTFGSDLFIGREPAKPDFVVTIFDTPGRPPLLTFQGNDGSQYYYPSVQIRVRTNYYTTGWNKINDIKTVLHGIHNEIWNGTTYDIIRCISEPFMLDWDENNRVRFVSTYNIYRKG